MPGCRGRSTHHQGVHRPGSAQSAPAPCCAVLLLDRAVVAGDYSLPAPADAAGAVVDIRDAMHALAAARRSTARPS